MTEKEVVYRIEPHTNRKEVLCTTYQMRNFYQQFGDGFISGLDVMNYIQHQIASRMARKGDKILDICCGRGLMLPLLRYEKKTIDAYVGVDIEPKNIKFDIKRVTDGKPIGKDYYPFTVHYVKSDVANMSELLPEDYFDYLIYTSSIEHMHPDHGKQSLFEARCVAKDGARMFLTCPNTPEDQDGYDTQYAAHVYEWKQSELKEAFNKSGWKVVDTFGLIIGKSEVKDLVSGPLATALWKQSEYVPWHWLSTFYAMLYPDDAKEIAYVLRAI